jgi:hypothetical protein
MFEQTTTKTVTFKGLKRLFTLLAIAIGIAILPLYGLAQKRVHSVFFDGTDHELHVYRIHGKIPGKTLLLIGGIQGDEPGGFISADHYADITLAKGNLIVVPRANFRSIILKRRKINEDMNRKFAEDLKTNYETKIVAILKRLIMESDCLLNLHDGSGFFSEKWESSQRNPKRYGQSIIADTEVFVNPKTGETVNLGEMARSVVADINKHIENRRHHFRFNNHRTSEKSSIHKEQRKSATYYALNTHGIAAFGIETSKSLSLEMKVRHHNLAINAFMDRMDIVPETPGINLEQPKLRYLVVSINDALPVVVKNDQVLYVKPGDEVMISHIEANYERGLTADIINYGSFSDVRKKVKIKAPTKVVVRKDFYPCGSINISIADTSVIASRGVFVADGWVPFPKLKSFKIKINDDQYVFNNFEHVTVLKGDAFEITDVISDFKDPVGLIVNFKGFVGDTKNNTGEDRGYVIKIDKDLWKRYSLNKKGKTYQIVVTYFNKVVGKLFVDLKDPV